jgi:uncharacterized membrane protein HdeD (DUF308 family)
MSVTKETIQLAKIQKRRLQIVLGITIVRGILVTILGLALFFQPEKTRPMLVNFMGFFYLASGIVSLRWGTAIRPMRRLAILAGSIGVLAGLITLGRHLFFNFAEENLVLAVLGTVMFLTGILHILGGFRTDDLSRSVTWGSIILGIFEIVLGTLLILTTGEISSTVYRLASLWAFVGGFLILADAWRLRAKLRQLAETQTAEAAPIINGAQPVETTDEQFNQ